MEQLYLMLGEERYTLFSARQIVQLYLPLKG